MTNSVIKQHLPQKTRQEIVAQLKSCNLYNYKIWTKLVRFVPSQADFSHLTLLKESFEDTEVALYSPKKENYGAF